MSTKITIRDIARALDISSTTVSFVLNNRQDKGISEGTRAKVIEKAAELGYKKLFRPFLEGWTRVAYITSNIEYFNFHTSFFSGVYNHLQRKAAENKTEFFLLELNLKQRKSQVLKRFQEILSQDYRVFLSNSPEIVHFLLKHNLKAILIQGGGVIDGCICVYCDDYSAGKLAAEHAFEMGHRVAGMIFPNTDHSRYRGFLDRYDEIGGRCPEEFRWFIPMDHDMISAKVHELSKEFSERRPSLFYCFADNILFPAIRGFRTAGYTIPDDISLIGTDNLYWGKYNMPAFTTVDLSEELFAEKVIEAIGHSLRGDSPYQLAVPVQLLKRETVRDMR